MGVQRSGALSQRIINGFKPERGIGLISIGFVPLAGKRSATKGPSEKLWMAVSRHGLPVWSLYSCGTIFFSRPPRQIVTGFAETTIIGLVFFTPCA
jgi:hypothetical protein